MPGRRVPGLRRILLLGRGRVAAALGHQRVTGWSDAAAAADVLSALDQPAHALPARVSRWFGACGTQAPLSGIGCPIARVADMRCDPIHLFNRLMSQ
jgi:hypothetical protein